MENELCRVAKVVSHDIKCEYFRVECFCSGALCPRLDVRPSLRHPALEAVLHLRSRAAGSPVVGPIPLSSDYFGGHHPTQEGE